MKKLIFLLALTFSMASIADQALAGDVMDGGAAGLTWATASGGGVPIQYNILTFGGQLSVGGKVSFCPPGSTKCYSYTGGTIYVETTGGVCPKGCTYTGKITGAKDLTTDIINLPDGSTSVQVSGVFVGNFTDPKGTVHNNIQAVFNSQTNPATDGVDVISGGSLVVVLKDN